VFLGNLLFWFCAPQDILAALPVAVVSDVVVIAKEGCHIVTQHLADHLFAPDVELAFFAVTNCTQG
jgi:ABC-type sulfate transport system substrate-binding protein